MKRTSTRTVTVESYVTLRSEWPKILADWGDIKYKARAHRVIDGKMEWRYFEDENNAQAWADAIHIPTNDAITNWLEDEQPDFEDATARLIKEIRDGASQEDLL